LPHAPEKVWRALTDPVLLAEWLLPVVNLEVETGAAFTFKAEPQPGWDGTVNCRFLEIEAHKMLSYAWVVRHIENCRDVHADPHGVRHAPLARAVGLQADQKRNFGGARYGWKLMGGKLVDLLAKIP
jgi:uncharacterized protein YndB with AHSA1/START domain